MTRKRIKHRRNRARPIFIGLLCFVLICGLVLFYRNKKNSEVQGGQVYVTQLEKKPLQPIKRAVDSKRQAEMAQAIKDGKMNIFSMFDNYVFLGDSRVMGYDVYGFLDHSRVLADSGATIKKVDDHLEAIKTMKPARVYLSYGVNDMGMDINNEQGGYGGVYEAEVKKILAVDPGAKIYICSIIPCTPATLAKSPRWGAVSAYNKQLKEICSKNHWTYIDCTSLADGGNADIYQGDGIHFLSEFYPVWAQKIIDASQQAES